MGDANKRAFRAKATLTPSYPRLLDMDAKRLRTWGLIAVGGLALGSADCKPNAAVAGAIPAATAIDAGSTHKPVPEPEPPQMGGAPPPPRVEPASTHKSAKARPTETSPKKPDKPGPKGGKMRPPRLEPKN